MHDFQVQGRSYVPVSEEKERERERRKDSTRHIDMWLQARLLLYRSWQEQTHDAGSFR